MKTAYKTLILFCLILFLNKTFAGNQLSEYRLGGAIPPTQEEYESLPRVDWAVLNALSDKRSIQTQNSTRGIIMLNTPPIGTQSPQNSCVGWAFSYAVSILAYPKFNNNWNNARRSPSYIYNQIKISNDCNSNSYMIDGFNLVKNQGVCSWNLMPYNANSCTAQPNNSQRLDALLNNITSSGTLVRNDVAGIKQALNLGFPVVINFEVLQSFWDMWYATNPKGIWNTNTGASSGFHAGCIVGYDDTKQMFKVMNSWGTANGDNGFFWVTYNLVQNNALTGVYVLSGISQAIYPTIAGPSNICSNSTVTYTANNAPAGFTWGHSSQLTPAPGSPGSFTVPLMVINPNAWVSVNIGGFEAARFNIVIGTPVGTISEPYDLVCNCQVNQIEVNKSYQFYAQNIPPNLSPSDIVWELQLPPPYNMPPFLLFSGYSPIISFSYPGAYTLQMRWNGLCGYSPYAIKTLYPANKSFSNIFITYPNPVIDVLNVEINRESIVQAQSFKTYDIRLYDNQGNILRQASTKGEKVEFSVSNLSDGYYYLHIYNGTDDKPIIRQIMVQR